VRVGTWGAGIFQDDVAADVRGDWRGALLDGLEPAAATTRVLDRHRDAREDEQDGPVVWLALAAAQAETGRLEPGVRDKALSIVEGGEHLRSWETQSPTLAKQRAKALDRLATKLRGPQKLPVTLKRPRPRASRLGVGDVVHVRGEGGEALFVVVELGEGWPPGSTEPVVATLAWIGGALPTAEEMESLPLVLDPEESRRRRPVVLLEKVLMASRGQLALAPFGEVVATGVRRRDAGIERSPRRISTSWRNIAAALGSERFRRRIESALQGRPEAG
jgi:hypothetical protein